MRKILFGLLLTSLALTAGDLTGKWTGKFDITSSNGDTQADHALLNLKLDGATVTGTAGPNENKQWNIQEGKLENGKLTFKVDMEDGGSIKFDLVFEGDSIRGNAKGTDAGGESMSAKVDLQRT